MVMVRLLYRLDLLILGEIEKLSHAIQRLTGFDCFHQRNSMYAAMAGLYACALRTPAPVPLGAPRRSSQELPGAANQAVLEAMWPK
jgi:hypothetical protein